MAVTSETEDQEVPCGFIVQGTEYTHTATLDIIKITCPEKMDIVDGKAVNLACTISESKHIEPIKAVWYKGKLTSTRNSLKSQKD